MANTTPPFDPLAWIVGLVGTISLAWVGSTSRKVNKHEVEIAVLKEGQTHIVKSLDRLEEHLGTKPKE